MEGLLSRLRDFSRKDTGFDQCGACGACGAEPRPGQEAAGRIQAALTWLRKELMEMRSQDQALVRQLMDLHHGIQELKQECLLSEEEEEEEEEEHSWASGSSLSSFSGEIVCFPSIYFTNVALGFPPKRTFIRRSSVP